MRVCPTRGAVFLCGGPHVVSLRGRDLVLDRDRENGLPRTTFTDLDGVVDDVSGSFPDDAWLTMRSPDAVRVYRWKSTSWSLAYEHAGEGVGFVVQVVRGGDPPLLLTSGIDEGATLGDAHYDEYALRAFLVGGRPWLQTQLDLVSGDVRVPLPAWSADVTACGTTLCAYGGDGRAPELARLDGTTWRELPVAGIDAPIRALFVRGDTTWALADDLFVGTGGAFARITHGERIERLWIDDDDHVWTFRHDGGVGVLSSSITPANVSKLDR
jgi:hypothetical protein